MNQNELTQILKDLGMALQKKRINQGTCEQSASELAGISRTTLRKIENGECNSINLICLYCDYLHYSLPKYLCNKLNWDKRGGNQKLIHAVESLSKQKQDVLFDTICSLNKHWN